MHNNKSVQYEKPPILMIPKPLLYIFLSALLAWCGPARQIWAGNAATVTAGVSSQIVESEIAPTDLTAGQQFGSATAVSGDTLAVGAPGDGTLGANAGAVYLFVNNNGQWTQQAKLTGSSVVPGDRFGHSVALDGDVLAVGTQPNETNPFTGRYAVYVFRRVNNVWTQEQRLNGQTVAEQYGFGFSVALSGQTLAVGAITASQSDNDPNGPGAVIIFRQSGGVWERQLRLISGASPEPGRFGASISLQGDTLAIGEPGPLSNPNFRAGNVYIYVRQGNNWIQQASFGGRRSSIGNFGSAVSLDGPYIAVTSAIGTALQVNFFRREEAEWSQEHRLTVIGSNLATDTIPSRLALRGDSLLLGNPANSLLNQEKGAAFLFRRVAGEWRQQTELSPANGAAGDNFGGAAAWHEGQAIIAAPLADSAGSDAGRVYSFNALDEIQPTSLVLTASANQVRINQRITLTATVQSVGGAAAAGNVQFYLDNQPLNAAFLPLNNGQAQLTFTVLEASNSIGPRTFSAIYSGRNAAVSQSNIPIIILPPVTLSIADAEVDESNSGATPVTVRYRLSEASEQPVTATIYTQDSSATTDDDDYQATVINLEFAPGEIEKQSTAFINGDSINEEDEIFFLRFNRVEGADGRNGDGTISIRNDDNDERPVFAFTSDGPIHVNEGEGRVALNLRRSGNTAIPATAQFQTTALHSGGDRCITGSLRAGATCDYTPTYGTVKFAPGETDKTVVIPLVDDYYAENNELLQVDIVDSFNGAAFVTIEDNDTERLPGITFLANLSNSGTPAGGIAAGAFLTTNQNLLTTSLTLDGLTGPPTAIHLHGPAYASADGPVLHTFAEGETQATILLTADSLRWLKANLLYFDVHTQAHPEGELRGQMLGNPLEDPRFFVRQNYHDFLEREPDATGWDYWTGQIREACGVDVDCLSRRRVEVGGAFALSDEFLETGGFILRLQYLSDPNFNLREDFFQLKSLRSRLLSNETLEGGKLELGRLLTRRNEFVNRYPPSLNNPQLLASLLNFVAKRTGVLFSEPEQGYLLNDLNAGGKALLLINLANHPRIKTALANRVFVAMHYFGYLGRNAEAPGFNYWLNVLNQNPNRKLAVTCAFITSAEYQKFFSNTVTRSNADCAGL